MRKLYVRWVEPRDRHPTYMISSEAVEESLPDGTLAKFMVITLYGGWKDVP